MRGSNLKTFYVFILLLALFFLSSCAKMPDRNPEEYIRKHPNTEAPIKQAIINGVVIKGMCPNEAIAAAGSPGPYYVRRDLKWESGTPPPAIILAQCEQPDGSHIELKFRNKTQFKSSKAEVFRVVIENGKVIAIDQRGFKE